jgi:hypothetical protein
VKFSIDYELKLLLLLIQIENSGTFLICAAAAAEFHAG